jgi:DNA polymerase-1
MIKTLGVTTDCFQEASVEEIIDYFKNKEYIQVDSETLGFDPYTSSLVCVQLGDFKNQFLITREFIGHFKPLLESKILIGHNIKFDLKFLYRQDIWPTRVWDTFLAESLITCGLKTAKRGLGAVAKNRLGVDLDKTIRAEIAKEGLSKRVIQYSADDVKYLELIKASQEEDLRKLELERALEIENQFVIVLAYIEYCGFKLDKKAWQKKMDSDIALRDERKHILDRYLIDNNHKEFISSQLDLFSTDIQISLNWGSSKQVIAFFKKLGIPTKIIDKGVEKDSVESNHIEKYASKFPIIRPYLDFKEAEKVVTTYGKTFIDQINPITGRLHTNFRQIMDTGRISSGGKNKMTKESYQNFQNIPSDKETRGCFIAEEGNLLGISDYSGQEQVVLANKSLDPNLLKFYDEGSGDMHVFVCRHMYPELKDLSVEEIKTKHKDKRQEAKIAGFVVNYGGCAINIAEQLNKTIEVGERIFEGYFRVFPGLKTYFNRVKARGLSKGYILVSELTGRKAFVDGYEEYQKLNKEIDRLFWERWKDAKEAHSKGIDVVWAPMKEKISKFFKIKGAIERKSLNYPIQGTAAEITKLSAIYFFDWIRQNDLIMKVLMVNQIHDENIIEAPKDLIEEASASLKECMERAGEIYCKRVKLKADPVIASCWQK